MLDRLGLKKIVTKARLKDIDKFIPFLSDYQFNKFGLDTPNKKAAFISQIAKESQYFQKLSENLNYTSGKRLMAVFPKVFKDLKSTSGYLNNPQALAKLLYEGRRGQSLGLGNRMEGDGFKYRGRGLIMITGRAEYERIGLLMGLDLISRPELLEQPRYAVASAFLYWQTKKGNNGLSLSQMAEKGLIDSITKAISNSTSTKDERREIFLNAVSVFANCQNSHPETASLIKLESPNDDIENTGRVFSYEGTGRSALKSSDPFDVITNFNKSDAIIAPKSFRTESLANSLGQATSLDPAQIRKVLTTYNLPPDTAGAFTLASVNGTFLVLNDGNAGFQPESDTFLLLRNYIVSPSDPIFFV